MATPEVPAPRLPEAPQEYSSIYMQDLLRALEVFIGQQRNPGQLRGSTITLTRLPTSPTGLETGALYNDAGTVKVAP